MRSRLMKMGFLLVVALAAFELFNFSVTEYALTELIGGATVAGVRWVVILTGAFCLMDLAGVSRLLIRARGNAVEAWFLLSAWFLVITFNSFLIWLGISLALIRMGGVVSEIAWPAPAVVAVLSAVVRVVLIWLFVSVDGRLMAGPESIET